LRKGGGSGLLRGPVRFEEVDMEEKVVYVDFESRCVRYEVAEVLVTVEQLVRVDRDGEVRTKLFGRRGNASVR